MDVLTHLRLAWGRARRLAGVAAQDDWRLYARLVPQQRLALTLVNFADGQHARHLIDIKDDTCAFFLRHGILPDAVRMSGVMRKSP